MFFVSKSNSYRQYFSVFIFICKLSLKKTARNIIFEVLTKSKVLNRLDLSDGFWEQFNVQNKSLKKKVGLYEVENINNTNILTIAINPKEYFEKYKDFSINKKHKALKKNTLQGWILRHLQKDLLHYTNIASRVKQKKSSKTDFR